MKLKAVLSILILICTQAYKMFQSAVEKSQDHLFRHRRYCVSLCLHTHACATHIHNTHTSHAHTQRKHALHSTHRHTQLRLHTRHVAPHGVAQDCPANQSAPSFKHSAGPACRRLQLGLLTLAFPQRQGGREGHGALTWATSHPSQAAGCSAALIAHGLGQQG